MLEVMSFACSLTLLINCLFVSDKNHGVILIPEGLVESIPELYALLKVTIQYWQTFLFII